MLILLRTLLIGLFCLFLFAKASPVLATTTAYKITDPFQAPPPAVANVGRVFFVHTIRVPYDSGKMILSGTPDGTGSAKVYDGMILAFNRLDEFPGDEIFIYNGLDNFIPNFCITQPLMPPIDLTQFFRRPGEYAIGVRMIDWCGRPKDIGSLYVVNTESPPTPFLDLPWDYAGEGLTFNEAALNINSFFDHEYPLLSSGLAEPDQIIKYDNPRRTDDSYSSHDGYDYGTPAQVENGDSVLAAASGTATYINTCGACGNAIHIDHGNGYQTRYYHLQREGLITSTPGEEVQVNAGDVIGRVGATGNVWPQGEEGAHIHFMIVQDKNGDGNFDDNIPDGVTDPFGWQSTDQDPWESYAFFYNGLNRTGNKSFYLWKKKLDGLKASLAANGGIFSAGRYTVAVPQGATNQNLTLELLASPLQRISDSLVSVGSAMQIAAKDPIGNLVTIFQKPFTIGIDFSTFDLSRFKVGTISIYSSSDGGKTWKKEDSFVDFLNKKATTEVDHLTLFTLMAERADTIAPTTTIVLIGDEGESGWFRSDVQLSLEATDNEEGLGVDYTMYKVDDGDWEEYVTPLQFSDEGNYKVEFYSVDVDENIEELKSVEFSIDKTPPTVSLDANPKTLWPPNGKMVNIAITGSSVDDHLFSTDIFVEDEYDIVEPSIVNFGQMIQLEAKRYGDDKDGRVYIIKATAMDKAGNTSTADINVTVPHDKEDQKAD
ncbi:MAG: peptidoglycan DD-metalloendopeptidase family protein [Candidatus Levybacteria bacterium]|nr:peptidoglycan DD-metalloendopeptidase family protein [Candidatus Levybacteria bacterium]